MGTRPPRGGLMGQGACRDRPRLRGDRRDQRDGGERHRHAAAAGLLSGPPRRDRRDQRDHGRRRAADGLRRQRVWDRCPAGHLRADWGDRSPEDAAAARSGRAVPEVGFQVDLDAGTVTCPADHTVGLRPLKSGQVARFGALCAGCPLAAKCTSSRSGARSRSASTSDNSPEHAPDKQTRTGGPTTDRPAPRSSARSAI